MRCSQIARMEGVTGKSISVRVSVSKSSSVKPALKESGKQTKAGLGCTGIDNSFEQLVLKNSEYLYIQLLKKMEKKGKYVLTKHKQKYIVILWL